MMKYIKTIVAFLIIAIMTTGVCGCMENSKRNITEEMVQYLNEKYDDTFTYKKPFGGMAGAESKKIICSSEKYPEKDVCVIYYEENNEEVFADNYMGVKYEESMVNALESALGSVFRDDYQLFYSVALQAITENASNDMTFEEYAAERSSGIMFTAVVGEEFSASDEERIAEELEKELVSRGICCRLASVYFNDGEKHTGKVEDISAYINKKMYVKELMLKMDNNEAFTSCTWR